MEPRATTSGGENQPAGGVDAQDPLGQRPSQERTHSTRPTIAKKIGMNTAK
jgi:hypothetical protein